MALASSTIASKYYYITTNVTVVDLYKLPRVYKLQKSSLFKLQSAMIHYGNFCYKLR